MRRGVWFLREAGRWASLLLWAPVVFLGMTLGRSKHERLPGEFEDR